MRLKLKPKRPLRTRQRWMWAAAVACGLTMAAPDVVGFTLAPDELLVVLPFGLMGLFLGAWAFAEYLSETEDYPPIGLHLTLACFAALMVNPLYLLTLPRGSGTALAFWLPMASLAVALCIGLPFCAVDAFAKGARRRGALGVVVIVTMLPFTELLIATICEWRDISLRG